MSSIILAFILGVLAGMIYMYLRYNKMLRNNLRVLEEIRLAHARTDGMIKALQIVRGVETEQCEPEIHGRTD